MSTMRPPSPYGCSRLFLTLGALLPGLPALVVASTSRSTASVPVRVEQDAPAPPRRIAVIAHRGGRKLGPENTLAVFRKAIALRVDFIEVDVRQTRDGQLVIMHDGTVDRTTNGKGAVAEMDLRSIRALDAGSKFGAEYAGEKVPTFEEVLALCKGRVGIYLDQKAAPVRDCLALVRKHGMEKSVAVYAGVETLKEWKSLAPEIAALPHLPEDQFSPEGVRKFHRDFPSEYLEGKLSPWDAATVRAAHAVGCRVFLDSDDEDASYQKALDIGVDGLQVDDPARLQRFLAMKGKSEAAPPAAPQAPPGRRVQLTEGQLFVPERFHPEKDGVDLTLHLHGAAWAAERNPVRSGRPGALVTITLPGLSAVYTRLFQDPAVFPRALEEAQGQLKAMGAADAAPFRHVTVTSFSAGFGGVRELLKVPAHFARIDALVMADSIHAGYAGDSPERRMDPEQMEGFLKFAREAASRRKWLIISHSRIRPGNYASTTETADYLLQQLEGQRESVTETWAEGLVLESRFRRGHLEIYGFAGDTGPDHMRHLHNLWQLMRRVQFGG
jgi:glycerophosphoryl diester phosphodiesterase